MHLDVQRWRVVYRLSPALERRGVHNSVCIILDEILRVHVGKDETVRGLVELNGSEIIF